MSHDAAMPTDSTADSADATMATDSIADPPDGTAPPDSTADTHDATTPPDDTAAPAWRRWLWGPVSRLGVIVGALTLLADQAHKAWMLHVYQIGERGPVHITPYFDLVLVWNDGISYGFFPQSSTLGQALLAGFAVAVCAVLVLWLARQTSALAAIALGLLVGGALGNAIDRLVYGAVADFFSLHAFGYYWYVFNIADAVIVAGVVGLVYESVFGSHKKVPKVP